MEELDVITEALRNASGIVRGGDRTAESKGTAVGTYDVVTGSDVLAERSIIDSILSRFPEDSIVSEETNPDGEERGRSWVIDPIDGTMNFSRGMPMYGMQAVFTVDRVPMASAIYLPAFDEMFTASGEGAFLNGSPISTAEPRPLKECIVSTGDYSRRREEFRRGQAVLMSECYDNVARFKMMGAACMDFAYLACGRTDIHIRFVNRRWDFLPGLYLAERAGAVYDRDLMEEYSLLILCSCGDVLEEAVEEIAPRLISCFRRSWPDRRAGPPAGSSRSPPPRCGSPPLRSCP